MKRKLSSKNTINMSLKRKVLVVLLALFFITLMSFADERRQVFNALYNTTTNDMFSYLGEMLRLPTLSFNTNIKVAYLLVVMITLVSIYTLIKMSIMKHQDVALLQHKRLYKQYDLMAFLAYILAIYVFINGFLFSVSPVEGGSMEPTIHQGDYLIIEHINPSYERLDFMVVQPNNHDQFMIKRLIGLPGETIMIHDDRVYVNGEALDESMYILDDQVTRCVGESPCTFNVEEGHYFFLGDNRTNSYDSRHFGPLNKDEIFGHVTYRIRPIRSIGRIE